MKPNTQQFRSALRNYCSCIIKLSQPILSDRENFLKWNFKKGSFTMCKQPAREKQVEERYMNSKLFVIQMITTSIVHDISNNFEEVLSSHRYMGKVYNTWRTWHSNLFLCNQRRTTWLIGFEYPWGNQKQKNRGNFKLFRSSNGDETLRTNKEF